jgi:probable HAF family extracellular repeat protein
MSDIPPGRRAAIRLGGITLAGAAALAGVAGTAGAAPNPTGAGNQACTWAAQVLPTVPTTTGYAWGGVAGTDGDRTFAGNSNGHAVLWRDGRLIDLGVGEAADVNGGGDAVGYQFDSSAYSHAILFRAGTAIRLAEPANVHATRATGINEDGLIVGTGDINGDTMGTSHALVWSASTPGRVTDLGTLDGDEANATSLVGVNEDGTLIGNVVNQNTLALTAVTGTVTGGLRVLPGSTPGASTVASIVGRYSVGAQYNGGGNHAVRWRNGRAQLLPGDADAHGVNSQGTVVGQRADFSTGVVWTGVGDPVDLPIPAGDNSATATMITDHGTVGGEAFTAASELQPVLWSCH